MAFITGSDEANTVEIVLFPKVYQMYPNMGIGDIILVNAKVEKRFDKYQLIVQNLKILNES